MAAIDKTYVTYEQFLRAYSWWKLNKRRMKKELGRVINIYYLHECLKGFEGEVTLWNTGIKDDQFLLKYCPLDFVQETLKYQYGEDYKKVIPKEKSFRRYYRHSFKKRRNSKAYQIEDMRYFMSKAKFIKMYGLEELNKILSQRKITFEK